MMKKFDIELGDNIPDFFLNILNTGGLQSIVRLAKKLPGRLNTLFGGFYPSELPMSIQPFIVETEKCFADRLRSPDHEQDYDLYIQFKDDEYYQYTIIGDIISISLECKYGINSVRIMMSEREYKNIYGEIWPAYKIRLMFFKEIGLI